MKTPGLVKRGRFLQTKVPISSLSRSATPTAVGTAEDERSANLVGTNLSLGPSTNKKVECRNSSMTTSRNPNSLFSSLETIEESKFKSAAPSTLVLRDSDLPPHVSSSSKTVSVSDDVPQVRIPLHADGVVVIGHSELVEQLTAILIESGCELMLSQNRNQRTGRVKAGGELRETMVKIRPGNLFTGNSERGGDGGFGGEF